jgi:small-conductance mechanosensitive channel
MKYLLIVLLCICSTSFILGQDTTIPHHNKFGGDTARTGRLQRRAAGRQAGQKKLEYFEDTVIRKPRKFDSSLFTNINVPSTSDYAEELRRIYQLLSDVQATTESFTKLDDIQDKLESEDSVLISLKEQVSEGTRTFNIRNVQMVNTVLDALDQSTAIYSRYLDKYDTTLDKVRSQIADLRKDTLMLQIFRDTALSKAFQPQLEQLKNKWQLVDSLVTINGQEINTLMSQASAHSITIRDLLSEVDSDLSTFGATAFSKERPYMWEGGASNPNYAENKSKQSINAELQLAGFYFSGTNQHRFWLLPLGLLFFYWIWSNFRILRRLDRLNTIKKFHFKYINAHPVAISLIFILSLTPFFDMRAPAIYSELIQLLLIILLTFIFQPRLNRTLFYGWCVFIILFLILPVSRILGLQIYFNRWMHFIIDIFSFLLAIYFLIRNGRKFGKSISFVISFFLFFKLLAVVCNVFGRVTLSQIFGDTAIYSFGQAISLSIFVQVVVESFLLQIHTSRIRKGYPDQFDFSRVSRSIFRFVAAVAIFLWLIIFTTNLNLSDSLYDFLVDTLTSNRQVGSFNFTLEGILLFVGIIWLANFLQKYIAYFFGDTGDDSIDDKGQRSRLMVTRLILLVAGFLLAVAASGLSVDRMTVILGALGVGIGLGLQGIVNNFVSGVILIFDRPLRVGDTVDIGDKRGRVKEIGIRSSTLLTEEGAEVIIPNGDVLSHNIVNWTLSNNHVRKTVSFTIQKPADLEEVRVNDIKEIVKKIPNVMAQKDPEVLINTVSSKAVELKISFWSDDFNKNTLTLNEVRNTIHQYLESKGILAD